MTIHPNYRIRLANQSDAATIARHRAFMFHEMGAVSECQRDTLLETTLSWIQRELAEERYVGWLAQDPEQVIAGVGIHLRSLPPGPNCLQVGKWGHIVNVYTEPEHRRRGIARRLIGELLRWCASQTLDQVTLTASDQGRPLYEELGFVTTADMILPRDRLNALQ